MTVREFIEFAKRNLSAVYDPRELDSVLRLVLAEVLHISSHQIQLKLEDELSRNASARLNEIVGRLATHEPVQYVLEFADFYGFRLKVNRYVLIPRPETEELVDYAVKKLLASAQKKRLSVLDVGTGSGCIAIVLKEKLPECRLTAIDVSHEAIAVAQENAKKFGCDIDFRVVDFLEESTWDAFGQVDAIVSNPPYVTPAEFSEMEPRVKNFEPSSALTASGDDPFIFYRKAARFGMEHLSQQGILFFELNSVHATRIESILVKSNYKSSVIKDLHGRERILVATKI